MIKSCRSEKARLVDAWCVLTATQQGQTVKSRLIVNALLNNLGFFLPFLQRLNRRKMVERTLWNQLVMKVFT